MRWLECDLGVFEVHLPRRGYESYPVGWRLRQDIRSIGVLCVIWRLYLAFTPSRTVPIHGRTKIMLNIQSFSPTCLPTYLPTFPFPLFPFPLFPFPLSPPVSNAKKEKYVRSACECVQVCACVRAMISPVTLDQHISSPGVRETYISFWRCSRVERGDLGR